MRSVHPRDPYVAALTAPFSEEAEGARVPDLYTASTVTGKLHVSVPLTTTSNGYLNVAFFADPFTSLVMQNGTNTVLSPYSSNSAVYYAQTPGNVAGLFASVRVVGAGLRIRGMLSLTSMSGRILVGALNPTGYFPGPNKLNNSVLSQTDIVRLICGTPGFPGPGLLEYPDSLEVACASLGDNYIEIPFRPVTPQAFMFKQALNSSTYSTSNSTTVGSYVYNGTPAPLGNTQDSSSAETYGWETICLFADGLPNSSACLQAEMIIHFEGTPMITPTVGAAIVAPSAEAKSPIDLSLFQKALKMAQDFDYDSAVKSVGSGLSLAGNVAAALL